MDEELKALIVEELKKEEKDWEEEEQAERMKGFLISTDQRLNGNAGAKEDYGT